MDKAPPRLRKLLALGAALLATSAHADTPMLHLDAPLEEYPAEALAQKLQGNVFVHLHISPDGSLRCSAQPGGKIEALKRPSCLLIAKRDIFAPFTDASGQALETNIDVTARWRIAPTDMQYGGAIAISPESWLTNADVASNLPPSGPWASVTLTFTVTPMGTPTDCKIKKSSRSLIIDSAACPVLMKRAMFLPALGTSGTPVSTEGTSIQNWWIMADRPK